MSQSSERFYMFNLNLNQGELSTLFSQPPETKSNGGFQALLVKLQTKVNRLTGTITLSDQDIERIFRYTWQYKNGGWQKKLLQIFGRNVPGLAFGGH